MRVRKSRQSRNAHAQIILLSFLAVLIRENSKKVLCRRTAAEWRLIMNILQEISTLLQQGRAPKVKELVAQAIEEGFGPKEILEEGLLSGMSIIGEKFKNNEVFVP